MKSKILFALFTLAIFCSGVTAGAYFGVSAGASPAIGQLWAGAKEMQAIVETIDNGDFEKAKALACMSIETRIVIMDATKPFGSETIDRQTREVEEYVFSNVNKDKKTLGELCL